MTAGRKAAIAAACGLALALITACTPAPRVAPAHDHPHEPRLLPPAAPGTKFTYEVRVSAAARELAIEATLPAGESDELSVDEGAEPFVRDVAIADGPRWTPIAPRGPSWFSSICAERGCRLRYRFLLSDAGRALDDVGVAATYGDVVLAPPSTWLLHPIPAREGTPYRFHVAPPPDGTFVTGVLAAPDGAPDTYEADISNLPEAPYTGFGKLRRFALESPGGLVDVAIAPGRLTVDDAALSRWVASAALAVSTYYRRFPVHRVALFLVPMPGREMGYSSTLGNGGASINLRVGHDVDEAGLGGDWVITHEMLHLAFPAVPREQSWLSEGIATYVEPIARARVGALSADEVWRGLAHGLPHGLPRAGDRGLDNTPTWGRKYWGGALFCLLADLRIRERTAGARSLDDALRAILDAGGDTTVRWTLEQVLTAGDRGIGLPILRELHAEMGPRPVPVDLDDLFRRLGVRVVRQSVTYDDRAPLAAIRKAITRGAGGVAGAGAVSAATTP